MKKKIAILISLMMVLTFALAACGGGGSEDLSGSKYLGTWKAESVSVGDESGELGDEGSYTLTLNGDGTGTFVSIDEDGTEIFRIMAILHHIFRHLFGANPPMDMLQIGGDDFNDGRGPTPASQHGNPITQTGLLATRNDGRKLFVNHFCF